MPQVFDFNHARFKHLAKNYLSIRDNQGEIKAAKYLNKALAKDQPTRDQQIKSLKKELEEYNSSKRSN